jgi:hypothetical protein
LHGAFEGSVGDGVVDTDAAEPAPDELEDERADVGVTG